MKKIISLLALSLVSTLTFAAQTVQIVWPFAVGSPQANMVRGVIESANSKQDRYVFVFASKPGAGGTVAANTVKESADLSILASTSSFYIRPLLYKDSHNIDQFSMVGTMCMAQPLAIYSKKISKVADAKSKDITLGVIPGSITTLVTRAIKRENPDFKVREIPYKGTPEATSDMLGGHIDGSVDFAGKSVRGRFDNEVSILGVTGKRAVGGLTTFASLGIRGLDDVTNDYYFFVNDSVNSSVKQDLYEILSSSVDEKVRALCEDDYGHVSKMPYNSLDQLNTDNKDKWKKLTQGIVRE